MTQEQLDELEAEESKGKKKNKKNKNKKNNNNKEFVELDYAKCDFPIPYSSQSLIENWFEFNDSSICPIRPGVLQSKFGGKGQGNAYMLMYRQRKANPEPKVAPAMPKY
mgnify:CR=1 FL=1|jgi:hypothetical protein